MKSPYKIKHWSPVRRVPKSFDGWYNPTEYEDIEADEYAVDSMKLYYMFMEYMRTLDNIPKDGVYMYNTDTKTFEPTRYTNDAPLGQGHDGSLVCMDDIDADEYENKDK